MSNALLQNTGIETFLNVEDSDLLGLEDGPFRDFSSFTDVSWTDEMCSEVDEDDLPLTNYLLKFSGEEEEPWESGEELSVGGDSVGDYNDEMFELGWALGPEDLDTGMFDAVKPNYEKEKSSNKKKLGKKKLSPARGMAAKKEPTEKNVVVDNKKQTKNSPVKNIFKVSDSVQSAVKSTNAADTKVVVSGACNSTKKEPQKSLPTAKSQAEKAKEQRERKKKYIQELQDTIAELKRDKADLHQVTVQLSEKIESLKDEISYLKGVITNQSELATILRSVANSPGVSISCSVLRDSEDNSGKNNKRKFDPAGKKGENMGQDNNKKMKVDKNTVEIGNNAGVCVHVQSGKVSLEFCAECSKKANSILT